MDAISPEEYMVLEMSRLAGNGLQTLLESKHLYQKIELDPIPLARGLYTNVAKADPLTVVKQVAGLEGHIKQLMPEKWPLAREQMYSPAQGKMQSAILTLVLKNVGLYCARCGRREAFAPLWWRDATQEICQVFAQEGRTFYVEPSHQTLFLTYQCQRCNGVPEAFLVQREKWVLSLHGRFPMETVEIPAEIPKVERKFYRDAIIAFNSGKVLAALFYLRTFIEQFGRRITGRTGKSTGEEIFDAYADTLPSDLKSRMPSLREWYEKLSEALHSAREDSVLFESAKAEICKHFDIRRVFGITETPQLPLAASVEEVDAPQELEPKVVPPDPQKRLTIS